MRILLLILLLFVTPAAAQQLTTSDVLQAAVDKVIRPGFNDLRDSAAVLDTSVGRLCAVPSDATLTAARTAFAAAAIAHARVENFRFGPLTSDNRAERLLFWPDPKGIALKQVQAILSAKDETATDPAALAKKSVAVQGLNALEYVLHGTGADELLGPDGAFRCRYGQAIAASIKVVTADIAAAWNAPDQIAAHLTHPGPANDDFRTETEALEGLAGVLSHGVEAIRDTRLLPFLGGTNGKSAPRAALFWRSGLTVAAVDAEFEGLRRLLNESRIGELSGQDWVLKSADFEFGNVDRATATITLPVAEAIADPAQKKALDYLVILTGSLQDILGTSLPGVLGLSVGFSALDGD